MRFIIKTRTAGSSSFGGAFARASSAATPPLLNPKMSDSLRPARGGFTTSMGATGSEKYEGVNDGGDG